MREDSHEPKNARNLQKLEKNPKEMGPPLDFPERNTALLTLILVLGDPCSGF